MRYGLKPNKTHGGGRNIWFLKDNQKFIVCWKISIDQNPEDEEYYLLEAFKEIYRKLPFANCKSGNKPKMIR